MKSTYKHKPRLAAIGRQTMGVMYSCNSAGVSRAERRALLPRLPNVLTAAVAKQTVCTNLFQILLG